MFSHPGLSTDKILELAARPDGLFVNMYNYRDETLRRKVKRLCKAGKLVKVGKHGKEFCYKTRNPA